VTRIVSSSLWALLVLLLLLAPSAQGQPAPAASLDLCLAAAADGSCVYPTRVFRSPTTAVVVVYQVAKGESQPLTARLTIVDVGGAFPANAVISKQDMRPGGLGRGILTFMGPPLPMGKYRVDVTAGGKAWKSLEFAVTAAGAAPDITRPEDLLPLATGKAWTYAWVQEAGKTGKVVPPGPTPGIGEKVGLSGIAPDADGKSRATVTLTAASTDQAGTRIETRRAGALVFEEWWRLDERGWTVTQRKGPLGIAVLDPPQVLLPRSLTTPQEWTYEPTNKSFRQTYRMWGPFPVRGPQGETPGYVVLVEQPSPLATTTVERHFLRGVGMIREVSITAVGSEMVSHTELALQAVR